MNRRIPLLFLSCFLILTLVVWSCNGTPSGEQEQEEEEEEEEGEPAYEELQAAQRETMRLLDELDLFCDTDINIQENQVEVYVTDSRLFNETLQEANTQLPSHVAVIVIYEPLYEIPLEVNPDPSIHLPQLKMRSGSFMEAELFGELALEDGYLRVGGTLIIWQPDYFVHNNEGTIEILDRNSEVVGRVGEEIYMGGGEITSIEYINKLIKEPLPQDCEGPYWLMGEIVPMD